MPSPRKKVVELQRALEEASREFGLLADELEFVHRQLKGRTKNADQIRKLQEAQTDAVYLAGRFYALSGDGLDPEASGELGRWGSRVGKGAAALLFVLSPAADASQVLGADLSTVMEQSESATAAAEKVTTCSLNVYLPGTDNSDAEPDEDPASASDELEEAPPKFEPEEIRPGTDLSNRDLSGASLRGAELRSADLTGANLTKAYLTGANLTRSTMSRANLTGTDLVRSKWDPKRPPKWPQGFTPPENAWDPDKDGPESR